MNTSTEQMTPEKADWMARCFVNGARRHSVSGKVEPISGEFAEHFRSHPWVREAITEGWGKELRGHIIHVTKLRIMRGQPYQQIEDLMPPKDWIANAKDLASRFRKAEAWQKQHMPNGVNFSKMLKLVPKDDDEGQAA